MFLEKSEVDVCQLSLTLIKLLHNYYVLTSHLNLQVKLKAMWQWASNAYEAAGVDTLEVVVADLHTGGSGLMVAFVLTEAAANSAST